MSQGGSGLVVYGDFSCVRSYVASQCLDALKNGGVDLEWRAIERHRDLPVAGRHRDEHAMAAIGQDLVTLGGGSSSGIVLPERALAPVPKTKAAVSAYAEACGAHVRVCRGDDHLPAPAWRPSTTVLPPETWTTQVGNPWNRTARMRRQASAR